jgi:hypothetical protein
MEPLTPQLAKLIVLKLQQASLRKMQEQGFWETEKNLLSSEEQKILNEAVNNQLEVLQSNITYQERMCK